ncbi:MAG: ATP phosphoribosyltransferase [Mogibacterium sp.]|nr:ATP phosphoribosyltransferase [Mogibacterium sp.]
MSDFEKLLKYDERTVFALRGLYEEHGYRRFRAGKFEEYETYGRYKDFLGDDGILTFTDPNGKLMALNPDLTLSIAQTIEPVPTELHKYYYNDDVYRMDRNLGTFREISQVGIECIGPMGDAEVLEVITLAVKSLNTISRQNRLILSHVGLIREVASQLMLPADKEERIVACIGEKNVQDIRAICGPEDVSPELVDGIETLIRAYGPLDKVLSTIRNVFGESLSSVGELEALNEALKASGLDKTVRFDFSVVNDMGYYNGFIFQGFVKGLSTKVLSGGRYDNLLLKMGKRCGAIGFGIYLDPLKEMQDEAAADAEEEFVNVALPKGRLGESVYEMFAAAGYDCPDALSRSRKLIFENADKGIRYFWVKPSDVAIYVERGAADVGVVGKDVLLETEPDVYELVDLRCGICQMMVAGQKNWVEDRERTLKVATKFPNVARKYYGEKSRDIDIIKLNGSIELAPLLGLSDVIVDIVETGRTLRANGLEVKEEICGISARLISNKASHKFKTARIRAIARELQDIAEARAAEESAE